MAACTHRAPAKQFFQRGRVAGRIMRVTAIPERPVGAGWGRSHAAAGTAIFDCNIASFDVARFPQAFVEGGDKICEFLR